MKDRTNIIERSNEEWLEMVEKYFDAQTTLQEERELRRFLTTSVADAPDFDEIKAIMGFAVTGRAKSRKKRVAIRPLGYIAATAAVVIMAIVAGWHLVPEEKDICIAFIDSIEYTDEATVVKQMEKTFGIIAQTTADYSIDNQMEDLFKGIKKEE